MPTGPQTQPPLTDADLAAKIRRECMTGDQENDHWNADRLLIKQLEMLGYPLTVAAYENIGKWYA